MTQKPDKAFILAAGKGTRLRPYTDEMPKPMVEIEGIPLIGHILERMAQADINQIIVNTHYMGKKLRDYLKTYKKADIHLLDEETLLDTGGGIKNGLEFFENQPFWVVNGDAYWQDAPKTSAFKELWNIWDAQKMDIALLLQDITNMHLTKGVGDYDITPDHQAVRSKLQQGRYMFTSIRLNHPRIFKDVPDGAFSYLQLMDKAEAKNRLHACAYKGDWHHISTPQDLENVRTHVQRKNKRATL